MSNRHQLNPDHIQQLCSRLELGVPREQVAKVYGGFNNRMWRIETDRRSYAIKQLSVYNDLRDPARVQHFNVSENIAESFVSHGIPAVPALRVDTDYLQIIDNTGYLVYPWSQGVTLARTQLEEGHALTVAGLLARMHCADIKVPGVRKTRFDPYPTEKIEPLLRKANDCSELSKRALFSHLATFVEINEACAPAALLLRRRMVIGHGDMDQKNVLWDALGNPAVIDWESTRQLNPTYELINLGLDWGGISSNFDADLFKKILSAYRQAGGTIDSDYLQASFACIVADWLTWFFYVVAVCLDKTDPKRRAAEAEQIDFVLPTILRLQRLAPELEALASAVADA